MRDETRTALENVIYMSKVPSYGAASGALAAIAAALLEMDSSVESLRSYTCRGIPRGM